MGKPPTQVHGHQGHDLHGFAGPGGLFDQHVFSGPANIGHQTHLIGPQLFGSCIHVGFSLEGDFATKHLYKFKESTTAVSSYPCSFASCAGVERRQKATGLEGRGNDYPIPSLLPSR